MDRRTKEQCYQRFVYSLKDSIRHGPFTDAEDMLLIIGKELYGSDWAKISEMTPCRLTSVTKLIMLWKSVNYLHHPGPRCSFTVAGTHS